MNAKSIAILAIVMVFGLSLNAQRQYKHPRVKVKAETQSQVKVKKEKVNAPVVTPVTETVVNNETATLENTTTVESTTTASTEGNVTVKETHKPLVKKQVTDVKEKKHTRAELVNFTQKLLKHTNLMKVQDIKKTNMETWVLVMIILYAAGFLFLILAVVFIFALYSPIAWIFWLLMALCWIGASVVLILGLTGVM